MNLDKHVIECKKELISYLLYLTEKDLPLSEDIYQDLFIKVRKTALNGKYVEEDKLIYWLKRVAKNLVIDYYRKNSKLVIVKGGDEYNLIDRVPCIDEEYKDTWVTDNQSERLREAIDRLPSAQRELIHMRYYRNMSYKEIVEETGEKQSNLLPRMHYTIKKLQKQLC